MPSCGSGGFGPEMDKPQKRTGINRLPTWCRIWSIDRSADSSTFQEFGRKTHALMAHGRTLRRFRSFWPFELVVCQKFKRRMSPELVLVGTPAPVLRQPRVSRLFFWAWGKVFVVVLGSSSRGLRMGCSKVILYPYLGLCKDSAPFLAASLKLYFSVGSWKTQPTNQLEATTNRLRNRRIRWFHAA